MLVPGRGSGERVAGFGRSSITMPNDRLVRAVEHFLPGHKLAASANAGGRAASDSTQLDRKRPAADRCRSLAVAFGAVAGSPVPARESSRRIEQNRSFSGDGGFPPGWARGGPRLVSATVEVGAEAIVFLLGE